jgi:Flp pilus assembly protein TadG
MRNSMTSRQQRTPFHRHRSSRGAALVEFGIVAPLLFLLVFGIIEFGWGFLQYLDVRHGAREAGRLAAVNFGPGSGTAQSDAIIDEICTRIDNADGVTITISMPGGNDVGDRVQVDVVRTFSSLTGFFNFTSTTLESHVEVRLEQDATFAARTRACP